MSSHRRHKRSRSRESSQHSSQAKKHKSSRHGDDNREMFSTILGTLKDLKSDINSCTTRISSLEDRYTLNGDPKSPREDQNLEAIEQENDTISVVAGNDLDPPELVQHEDSAIQPPNSAIQPPNSAIQPPISAIQPPTSISPSLYDPETAATSWSPSEDFTNFLEKNFRRKLTFDQVCDILEAQAVPSVEALLTPTLDPSMLQHVAFQNKKFVQERDKELAVIQRAMLNATGPLCTLHDLLEQDVNNLETSDLKVVLEQTLCLLGSANTHMSILRRKKVLASINKSKIDLANQPLPNAKNRLFGDDFPSIASKEAELSRGLAKNLAPVPKTDKSRFGYGSRDSRYSNLPSNNAFQKNGKYQNFRQNQKAKFFRAPRFQQPQQPRFQQPQQRNSHSSSNNGKA